MKRIVPLLTVLLAFSVVFSALAQDASLPKYKKIVLSDKFFAEGSSYGDFNRDGKLDIVAGPYWYEGPDFQKKHEIYPAEAFDPEKYSDNFTVFTADFNGDGWPDVFVCPHPGTRSYWFENNRGKEGHWTKHMALEEVGNESQQWVDVLGTGVKGPIYNMNGKLGFGTYKVVDGAPVWKFHQVSNEDKRYKRYTHGIGAGDVNGDGRVDLLEAIGWWEQPENADTVPWIFHPYKFGDAPSHILVYDVDGDGLNDVVCAWHCHLYGLCWFKQVRRDGQITFERNEIMPIKPDEKPGALSFSQMHAFDLADFNGDGIPDFVTGKRWWAHGSKGDVEANHPSVLYWFQTKRAGGGKVEFVPHRIDTDSGVGTQVTTADLNGDRVPDIIVCNKKGTFVFLSQP